MGELKATPGNWFAANQRDIQAGDPEMPWEVATTVGHLVGGDEERMANAHLIAAAPDLYDALHGMHRYASADPQYPGSPAEKKALAALAKARGES